MSKTCVSVSAAANIALIKYWGKETGPGNQPATGSLSIGLEGLRTETTLAISDKQSDLIDFNDSEASTSRIVSYFEEIRDLFNFTHHFVLTSRNFFPTGTGLASSASGFAALAIALDNLLQLELSDKELSRLAMRGSGSAARSIYGGFVEVVKEQDAFARQIQPANFWPLGIIVAITNPNKKPISSTDAMRQTQLNSPFYKTWLHTHNADMEIALDALMSRDFAKLADVSESNCMKMHASIMTSRPSIIYWHPATLAIIRRIQELRNNGLPCFFTIDAGAQVKIIFEPAALDAVKDGLSDIQGIKQLIETQVGGEPRVL